MKKAAAAIAIILTCTVCIGYLLILVKPLITGEPNDAIVEHGMATIHGSMISVISLFVGAIVGKKISDMQKPTENKD